ncbi:hypothetical protein NBRC116583_23110 [Arenicella sp. 4NH20-0111]|uniref:TlpA family protein disulfide reductase n=1 Tax=Arenicella sp. 4NH20-0111 TaxID=3127648 RepID=UPI0031085375
MKNVLIICAALSVIGFWLNSPSSLPVAHLNVIEDGQLTESGFTVGGKCTGDKCLTVYVAPWCSACKALTPTIIELTNELEQEGISAQVVIGHDSLDNVKTHSKRYAFPVFEDASGLFYKSSNIRGVPYFAVTDSDGRIVDHMSGGYKNVETMRNMLNI